MPAQLRARITEIARFDSVFCAVSILAAPVAAVSLPGQFLHIACGEHLLLRRPISICDAQGDIVKLVFEIRGEGTKWLAERQAGEELDVLGPLGHGFDVTGEHILLVGGGIGVPPMFYAAKKAAGRKSAILGFRSVARLMMREAFQAICETVDITTDDGSFGEHAFVSEPLRRRLEAGGYDAVLACGPKAMLRSVFEQCKAFGVPCQVSLEERMGCGIGACLVCACKTQVNREEMMRHVCKDGPVFRAEEVVWE